MADIDTLADSESDAAETQRASRKKAGRSLAAIRVEFDFLGEGTGCKDPVKCKHCSKEFNDPRPHYLERHILTECAVVPAGIKKNAIDKAATGAGTTSSSVRSRSAKRCTGSSLTQSNIGDFVNKRQKVTDAAQDASRNAKLLRWLVSSGLSFHTVQDPHFVQFIDDLAPAYSVAGASCCVSAATCAVRSAAASDLSLSTA